MQKPAIVICINQAEQTVLKEVLAGIEEEMVLFEIREVDSILDARKLAQEAAVRSIIEVGVGIYKSQVVLQPKKTLRIGPLLDIEIPPRRVGQNAARFVKNKPLII